jgi:hypothetical protein
LKPREVVARRLRAQRLVGEAHASVAEAVAWSGAVQAQVPHEARWSLGMRLAAADDAVVQAAIDTGAVIRTHALRPTWHYLAADDLRWIQRLTAPRVHQLNGHYYRRLGLTPEVIGDSQRTLRRLLADGPRIKREMADALGGDNLAVAYTLIHAELECLVISGPRRGTQHTYVLGDDVLPEAPERSREEDLAELARRYFQSHAPASAEDFAWWGSLTLSEARPAAAPFLEDAAGPPPAAPAALLLPTYDEVVVAYRSLRQVTEDGAGNQLHDRPLWLHGRHAGSWKRTLERSRVVVAVTAPDDADESALAHEAERFGRFLGLPAHLERG